MQTNKIRITLKLLKIITQYFLIIILLGEGDFQTKYFLGKLSSTSTHPLPLTAVRDTYDDYFEVCPNKAYSFT